MKISTAQFFSNSITQMQRQQTKVAQLQTQLGTGSQLVNPSDDASKASTINRLNSAIERQSVFSASLDAVESRLGIEEVALRSVNDLMQRVSQLTISAASDTLTAIDRKIVAAEIEGIRDELFNLANTQDFSGHYIFAGSKSTEPAFIKDEYNRVTYNGDYASMKVGVSENRDMTINNIGARVFSYVNRDPSSATFGASFTSNEIGGSPSPPAEWVVSSAQHVSGGVIAGFSSPEDDIYPEESLGTDDPTVSSSNFATSITNNGYGTDEHALTMNTTATLDPYGIVRGPVLVAAEAKNISVGDRVSLSYKVPTNSDSADVMVYLLNTKTGESQPVVNNTLTADDAWHEIDISVDAYGDYKLVIVGGAYDADGDGSVNVNVQIGEVRVERPGEYQRADYFQVLDELLRDLGANDGDAIRKRLGEVGDLVDNNSIALSETAGRSATIASQKMVLEESQLRLRVMLSGEKDIDYSVAVTELSKEAMALEALQASFAKISQLSLFDYIR